jgi:hypothetical protein
VRINEAIVRGLESVGVDAAFGGVGENVASAVITFKHSGKIKAVVTRNEQAASFAAHGHAKFAPKLGVCWAGHPQPVFRTRDGDVPLLPVARDLRLHVTRGTISGVVDMPTARLHGG